MVNPNKVFLTVAVLSTVLMAGCTMPWSSSDDKNEDNSVLSWSPSSMSTPSLEECKKAVQEYLSLSQKASIDTSKKVSNGSAIVVDYIGRLADGTVFDTSVESVAKACGVYAASRNYTAGLPFTVGVGQMIAGFDEGVVNMSLKETKTLTIPAEKAYGGDVVAIPRDQLPAKSDGSQYKAGETIMTINGAIKIETINDKEFTIKNNHPLAGKDLIFDITIKTIN